MQTTPRLQNIPILVVEDETDLREAVAFALAHEGAKVTEAENGAVAEEILEKQKFDIIVSDVRMPRMDGVGLLNLVRQSYPQVKVVLSTGYSEVLGSDQAFKLGAQGFLSKPFPMDALLDLVVEMVQGPKA